MPPSSAYDESGGFLQPALDSSQTPRATSHAAGSSLPAPRQRPLIQGSTKEGNFIEYVDQKMLAISRRYEKRLDLIFEESGSEAEGRGYHNFGEMAKDLEAVVDVVWVSGTPMLQISHLLTLALTVCNALPSFPFFPKATFHLLQKLDLAFSSLLQGSIIETGEPLPGFEAGKRTISTTQKVRMRGLVEQTRVLVVEVSGKSGSVYDAVSSTHGRITETEDETETGEEDYDMEEPEAPEAEYGHGMWEMEVARVYERTIVGLGQALAGSEHGSFVEPVNVG